MCLQLSTVMHVSLPGQEGYHTVNDQIIAGAFIWDQLAILDRCLIPSSQTPGWKCHKLRQLLCEFSGIFLQVKLLWRRKRFSQPALAANSSSLLSLMVAYICFAMIILWNTLSWHARLLITHLRMFISSSSLDFFLPSAGSLALLLPSSDRRWSSICFFMPISHSLGVDRETSRHSKNT